jgi:hypothetical protein
LAKQFSQIRQYANIAKYAKKNTIGSLYSLKEREEISANTIGKRALSQKKPSLPKAFGMKQERAAKRQWRKRPQCLFWNGLSEPPQEAFMGA